MENRKRGRVEIWAPSHWVLFNVAVAVHEEGEGAGKPGEKVEEPAERDRGEGQHEDVAERHQGQSQPHGQREPHQELGPQRDGSRRHSHEDSLKSKKQFFHNFKREHKNNPGKMGNSPASTFSFVWKSLRK